MTRAVKLAGLVFAASVILGGAMLTVTRVWADATGDSGNNPDDDVYRGDCPAGFNSCVGASWREHKVGSGFASAAEAACAAAGTSSYYLLGYERYTGSIDNPTFTGQQISPDSGDYGVVVNEISPTFAGGTGSQCPGCDGIPVNFVVIEGQTMDWNTAYKMFQTAETKGVTNTEWGGGTSKGNDTSWFCYDEKWDGDFKPAPDVTPSEDTYTGKFYTQSIIDAGSPGGNGEIKRESDIDGDIFVKYSVSESTATVTFTHKVYNDQILYDKSHPEDPDKFEEELPKTAWNVTASGGGSGSSGELVAQDGNGTDSEGTVVFTNPVTVNFSSAGEEKEVCSTVDINPQTVTIVRTEHFKDKTDEDGNTVYQTDSDGNTLYKTNEDGSIMVDDEGNPVPAPEQEHSHYVYKVSSQSGVAVSQACAKIRYVPNQGGGSSGSHPASDVAFAGETVTLGWSTSPVMYFDTRRIISMQAVGYLVPVEVPFSSSIVNGGSSDPCSTYRGHLPSVGQFRCGELASNSGTGTGSNMSYSWSGSKIVDVPNYVGEKYCNGAGFNWQWWWAERKSAAGGWLWHAGSTYWTTFSPLCRTIAKKPSMATWNGGVATDSNVVTSTANRNMTNNDTVPTDASTSTKRKYGSWTENLASVGGVVRGFGSGATLSRGNDSGDSLKLSPLTIANTDSEEIGKSGVGINRTFIERMTNYLRPVVPKNSLSFEQNGNTQVAYVRGDLTIDRDLEIGGSYTNIFAIPAKVIFVDGDVNIKGDVRRIDAWIIATGKLNTCVDFEGSNRDTIGTTVARRGSGSGTYSTNPVCDQPLTFNAPVIAEGGVKLNRTYGVDVMLGQEFYTPAEVFNLSAESYLWAYAQSTRLDSSYTAGYVRELPPRY